MPTDLKLEAYLSSLDRALKPLSVSERADIVVEIKSHILSAIDRDPAQTMDGVIASLGEPETVANRYLLERDQSPAKPPISPIVKWLTIGFLGTVAMVLLFFAFALVRFLPILEKSGHISIGSNKSTSEASFPYAPGETRPIVIRFLNGNLDLRTADTAELSWDCSGHPLPARILTDQPKAISLEFGKAAINCDLKIPKGAAVILEATNAKLSVEEPRFHFNAKIVNGKVDIEPENEIPYHYELSAKIGKIDSFQSSPDPAAYKIAVSVTNGLISNQQEN